MGQSGIASRAASIASGSRLKSTSGGTSKVEAGATGDRAGAVPQGACGPSQSQAAGLCGRGLALSASEAHHSLSCVLRCTFSWIRDPKSDTMKSDTIMAKTVIVVCSCALTMSLSCFSLLAHVGRTGLASFYSAGPASSGQLTAAHRRLPFGTRVRVTRIDTGKNVIVRINDRGPFVKGRVIDVSRSAAVHLGMIGSGVTRVKLEIVREELHRAH